METSTLTYLSTTTAGGLHGPADELRLAASKGQLKNVQELLNTGASLDPDKEGRTALHYAAISGASAVVQLLISRGSAVDSRDAMGYTSLHRAAAQGHVEVIKLLVQHSSSINQIDDVHGNSALHQAAWNGYSETLQILLQQSLDIDIVNKAGFSSLHLSAQNGHNQCSRLLLYSGCNSSLKNNYGDTALHTAARYGHAGVTRILLSAKVILKEQNKNGDTALHIAAALKRRKIAKLLHDGGIDTSLKNKQNEKAVDVARRKAHYEMVNIIKSSNVVPKKGKNVKGYQLSDNSGDSVQTEKKEKKGFFFRKRLKKGMNKNAKDEASKEKRSVASTCTGTSAYSLHDQMAPELLLKGFRQHQQKQHTREDVKTHSTREDVKTHSTREDVKTHSKPVHGLLHKYVPQSGVQYYRDLAGNVRQGPIGFAPVCNCEPNFKKLEQKIIANQANMYDHIDATRQMLSLRLEEAEKQASDQVGTLKAHTNDQFLAEQKERDRCIHERALTERQHTQWQMERYIQKEHTSHVRPGSASNQQKLQRAVLHSNKPHQSRRLMRSHSDDTLSSCAHSKKSFNISRKHAHEYESANLPQKPYNFQMHGKMPRVSPLGELNRMVGRQSRSPDGISDTDATSFQEPKFMAGKFQPQLENGDLQKTCDNRDALLSRSESNINMHPSVDAYTTSTPILNNNMPCFREPVSSPVQMFSVTNTHVIEVSDSGYDGKAFCSMQQASHYSLAGSSSQNIHYTSLNPFNTEHGPAPSFASSISKHSSEPLPLMTEKMDVLEISPHSTEV